jgi:hypothetical protein
MTPSPRAPQSSIDDFIESYVCWREACDAVASAYALWLRSPAHERRVAFAAYQAALEQEDRAAHGHRNVQRRLAAEVPHPDPRVDALSN